MRAFPAFFILLFLFGLAGKAQVTVNVGFTAQQLAQMLVGPGVTISNVTGTGIQGTSGVYLAGKFHGGLNSIGIDSGIVMTTGSALMAQGPNNQGSAGIGAGLPGDPQLSAMAGVNTNDACALEFDFIPQYDTIRFRYVFGSDEYNSFVASYNDIFAFFISGPRPSGGNYSNQNIALIPNTTLPVSIFNINFGNIGDCPGTACVNCEYLVNNCGDCQNGCASGVSIEYDAYTVVLTAWAVVIPCQTYHLKLVIADAVDASLDSGVFLEAGSFSSPGITITPVYSTPGGERVAVEGCSYVDLTVSLPFPMADTMWLVFDSIRGTATNGVDCNFINDSIYIAPGQTSNYIRIIPVYDALVEPTETLIFYYSSSSNCTGTSFSSITVYLADWNPVNIGSDTTVCQGTPITYNAGENYRFYQWQDGSTNMTYSPDTSVPGAQTISVTVTDIYLCTSSDSLQLTVAPLPGPKLIRHN
ncbi:MAG: choice-of-anchor L domain-containing protein [Bacteroidales bacterium]